MNNSLFCGNLVTSNRIIYTPSAFARENLVHLQEVGTLSAKKPHTSSRSNLASYLFFLVIKGSGTLCYEGVTMQMKAGDCGFIDCRKPYSHQSSDDLWTLKWVHFYGPNMTGIYEKYEERGGAFAFQTRFSEAYADLIDSIFTLAGSGSYIKDMQISEKLMGLLTFLMEESWHPDNKRSKLKSKLNIKDVRDYLEEHFTEKITLEELAGKFYIDKFYLSKMFKEQYGITVGSFLLQARITKAKHLLRFTDFSIEQIAAECGMKDANYFTRMFKKIEEMTPGEYRKRW